MPKPNFQMPFPYGQRWNVYTHNGHKYPRAQTDWGQPPSNGKIVVASAPGTVTGSGVYNDGVSYVIIDHGGGWTTRYLHMQTGSLIRSGRRVNAADSIGKVGDVGSRGAYHLHYEQRLREVPQPVVLDVRPVVYKFYPDHQSYTSKNRASGSQPGPHTVVAWERANVRQTPRLSGKIVSYVAAGNSYPASCWTKGDTVTAEGYTNDIWIKLPLKAGGFGYVTAIYLKGDKYANLPESASC